MPLENFKYKIRWSNFTTKEARLTGEDEDAHIEVAPQANDMQGKGKDGKYKVSSIKLRIKVDKSASWVVKGTKNEELLKHEQGHYDLTAIGARELYKRVLALETDSKESLLSGIADLQTEVQELTDELNKLYDDQTDHSRKEARQIFWNTEILATKNRTAGTLKEIKSKVK